METIYFVLGMLSIIGAAFVATVVWGIVKINKLTKTIKQQEEWIVNNDRLMHESFNNLYKEKSRDFDDTHRRISTITEELSREMDKRTEELDRNINDRATNIISYVDSRVDKALGLAGAKQLIKG
jgi:biopolymer transport protein ExbB/TolQ